MNLKHVTRPSIDVKINPSDNITCFQVYLGSLSTFSSVVLDTTKSRLELLVKKHQGSVALREILSGYVAGRLAVAWRSGNPIFIKVTKD